MILKFTHLVMIGGVFLFTTAFKISEPVVEKLPSGMDLVLFQSDQLPLVDVLLLVKTGYRDQPQGKSGLVQLLSEVLDRGAGEWNQQQLAFEIEKRGANKYISADYDSFTIGFHGLSDDVDFFINALKALTVSSHLQEGDIEKTKQKIIDGWKHIGDDTGTLAAIGFERLMTAKTPYSRGVMHSLSEFRTISRQDLQDFIKKRFLPQSSSLVIVGRFDIERVKKQLRDFYPLTPYKAEPSLSIDDPIIKISTQPDEILLIHRPDAVQAEVKIGFEAPSIKHSDRYALGIANALFGEYFTSRLNRVIRDQLGLTYGIGSSFVYQKEAAYFQIGSSTRAESAGDMLSKTLALLKEFSTGRIEQNEISTAREYLLGSYPLRVASLSSVASLWLAGKVLDLNPDFMNQYLAQIGSVSDEQVVQAVKKHFFGKKPRIVIAGDAAIIKKSLRKMGFKKIKQVEAKDLLLP